jgi:hypothetical protein
MTAKRQLVILCQKTHGFAIFGCPAKRSGEKRNRAAAEARGEIIVHWDDDDWSARWRLRYQVEELVARSGAFHSRRPAAPGA